MIYLDYRLSIIIRRRCYDVVAAERIREITKAFRTGARNGASRLGYCEIRNQVIASRRNKRRFDISDFVVHQPNFSDGFVRIHVKNYKSLVFVPS